MAIREIRTGSDPALYKKSRPVEAVDDRVRALLDDMADTMYHSKIGGGLAANQVGILRRLVVADVDGKLLKLVNPRIVSAEGEQLLTEGCLSFPHVWGKVKRPAAVVAEALDENGESIAVRAEGALAQCLCHEIDHLDGIVFTGKIVEFVK